MPVRRSSADEVQSNSYSDFDHQHSVLYYNSSTGAPTVETLYEPNIHTVEPMGGLARDEVAELVALEEQLIVWTEDVNSGGHFEGAVEISTDSNYKFIGPSGNADIGGGLDLDIDPLRTEENLVTTDDIDIDVLRSILLSGHAEPEGSDNERQYQLVPYRNVYGEGPIFDRHDQLNFHMNHYKDSDFGASFWLQHRFVWDVREV